MLETSLDIMALRTTTLRIITFLFVLEVADKCIYCELTNSPSLLNRSPLLTRPPLHSRIPWTIPTMPTALTTTTTKPTTTIAWFPNVIRPNANDKPPMFTATIATKTEQPVCSATIISVHFLLSSCIRCLQKNGRPIPRDNVLILVGDLQTDEVTGMGISSYDVENVVLHSNCLNEGKYELKNDIGLIQTLDDMEFGPFVAPAKVPESTLYRPNDNRNWMLAAFRSQNTMARTLREAVWFVKVRAVQPWICRMVLNVSFYDPHFSYCTPYEHYGRTDSCWEDFGASLSLDNTLIGILIHKFNCGEAGSAGSFVNVAFNSPWIRSAVQRLSKGIESV